MGHCWAKVALLIGAALLSWGSAQIDWTNANTYRITRAVKYLEDMEQLDALATARARAQAVLDLPVLNTGKPPQPAKPWTTVAPDIMTTTASQQTKTVARRIAFGSVVKYAGWIVFGATLVYQALDWFYNSACESAGGCETGTSLDTWYNWQPPLPVWDNNVWGYNKNQRDTDTTMGEWLINNCNSSDIKARISFGGLSGGSYNTWPDLYKGSTLTVSGAGCCAARYPRDSITGQPVQQGFDSAVSRAQDLWNAHVPVSASLCPKSELGQFLSGHDDATLALYNDVLTSYANDRDANDEYQYQDEVLPNAVYLWPAPTLNQMSDNPYRATWEDTDGDTYQDYWEAQKGTDPSDPNSYPSTRPVGDPVNSPDTDGDGIPDHDDPCPTDPENACAGPNTDPQIDVSRLNKEVTQLEVLEELRRQTGVLEDIRDAEGGGEELEEPTVTGPGLDLPSWAQPELTTAAWDYVKTDIETDFNAFWSAWQTKGIFVLANWLPSVALASSGEVCNANNITILGSTSDIGFCQLPIHNWLKTTFRAVMLGVLMLVFYLNVAREGSS